ncbi:hypothetical protein CEUSTIGMA_g14098.t1 [Chlamydomonas eustigma]|uniref:Uncharacterized protein n=1 Tax=Chlamydomonas eustigma TaxID=1157962 RepID=A0A250XUC2_9CHLO|nr:hypothetical protein CEUSTIGMA_g14098.t1 [Chlamydomonas eustigma]|eukprot:GAX86691.1 hypothetical protein CEUSTIGMA_g14098.t1 [Chlamydomonas eustigma]
MISIQKEFDDLLLRAMIDHRITSPHHPETNGANGASERFVKTVKTGMARERLSEPADFDNTKAAVTSIVERAEILSAHCAIAGQNLLIAQHRDTLRRIKNRQRQERAVAAQQLPSQAAQPPAVIAPPIKRGRGRPKKLVSSLASLSPEPLPLTFDWTNMPGVLHGLSYLMPGPWSEYYVVYFANRVPGGGFFRSLYTHASAEDFYVVLDHLDYTVGTTIIAMTAGAHPPDFSLLDAAGSEYSLITNHADVTSSADYHLDILQPLSFETILHNHSMHILIVCPNVHFADVVLSLGELHIERDAFTSSTHLHRRRSWIQRRSSSSLESQLFILCGSTSSRPLVSKI